jgi:adenylylsulfate kinase-like enzyme
VWRIGYVARVAARAGGVVICAVVSPYAQARDEVRALARWAGTAFVEVYLHAPRATLVARDPKGLYAQALAGELQHFTGGDDPYEAPVAPELFLDTSRLSVAECTARLCQAVRSRLEAPVVSGPCASTHARAPKAGRRVERSHV